MNVFTHNFNPNSNSGPNKLQQAAPKKNPMILRLDGIYFNSEQDFKRQNLPIKSAYENADTVIFQSNFNKKLTEAWFGTHPNSHVIHNAYFGERIKDQTFKNQIGDREIWSCASSWRPHKRLTDNVKYFI